MSTQTIIAAIKELPVEQQDKAYQRALSEFVMAAPRESHPAATEEVMYYIDSLKSQAKEQAA